MKNYEREKLKISWLGAGWFPGLTTCFLEGSWTNDHVWPRAGEGGQKFPKIWQRGIGMTPYLCMHAFLFYFILTLKCVAWWTAIYETLYVTHSENVCRSAQSSPWEKWCFLLQKRGSTDIFFGFTLHLDCWTVNSFLFILFFAMWSLTRCICWLDDSVINSFCKL